VLTQNNYILVASIQPNIYTNKLKIVNFKKGNRDHKKLLKQDEDTSSITFKISILTATNCIAITFI